MKLDPTMAAYQQGKFRMNDVWGYVYCYG
jgi:hypothetical protein